MLKLGLGRYNVKVNENKKIIVLENRKPSRKKMCLLKIETLEMKSE